MDFVEDGARENRPPPEVEKSMLIFSNTMFGKIAVPVRKNQSLIGPVGFVNSAANRASDAAPYFKTSSSTLNLELWFG